MELYKGLIKKKTDKGYGFIGRSDGQGDVFFHARDLVGVIYDDTREGDYVEFSIAAGDKGDRAVNVIILES